MIWEPSAVALAEGITHRGSPWWAPVTRTPRHLFVPRWWDRENGTYALCAPHTDEEWLDAAYRDTSLLTRVGPLHADHAKPEDRPTGLPTSSTTLPSLLLNLYQHARINDTSTLLDVGTGSGYGTALAAHRLGSGRVTSVDVDPYLVEIARERLRAAGLRPTVEAVDATGPLPGGPAAFDRIVATVAVRTIPESWLSSLRLGGWLVTTIAGTSLIITAKRNEDGGASGRVSWDRAGFMHARHGEDYPPALSVLLGAAHGLDGEDVTTGPYPIVDVENAWDLSSMLSVTAPGIEHVYRSGEQRVAIMAHPDGSWARATAAGTERPTVHQGGPRRLWDLLDEIRSHWLINGELPVRGARVIIKPDGRTILARGNWQAELA
ncbi:methyltransferase domain-containing protein [Streptomyces sp. RKAG293]|uniref:methyltransferase domain-containing protein n=1 Tax=Streptomyces sp. RKAG293 TaxID=2893403 RepID=UPI002033BB5A|nr:methyltransferase domain-containing protein [Streptomyces sp. RKAG293]MCM2420318.1 methyltransferase domain-containing protein [Streptomyces sp. RKAG293]